MPGTELTDSDWLLFQIRQELEGCQFSRSDLRTYQKEIAAFIRHNPKCAVFADMGLGKTVSVLTALDDLFSSNELKKALIVAPLRVAMQTWPTELQNWKHLRWLIWSVLRADPDAPSAVEAGRRAARENPLSASSARSKAITADCVAQKKALALSPADIHIINREQVAWLVAFLGSHWPYDAIVLDESTSFADHNSSRFKAVARVAARTKRIVLLSGTPAPEGIADLFAQTYLLDGGKRFGRGITHFRAEYMMQDKYTRRWKPQKGAVKEVTDKLADICLIMKERDYLPARERLEIVRPIVLSERELTRYKEFAKTMILDIEDEGGFIEAVNSGVLHGKLLQLCSGAVYDAERKVHYFHDHKIEELRELREQLGPGEPIIVAYWFRPSLLRLQKAFPDAVTMDRSAKCLDDWNAGKIDMLFVHPQSAGHGLNMQHGPGRTIVFYDTPESLELYLQMVGRLDRSGQKRVVKVFYLAVQKTIEVYAVAKLRAKESAQDEIVRLLHKMRRQLAKELCR